VTRLVPRDAAFLHSRAARPAVLCGQESLYVFCLGIYLSFAMTFLMVEFDGSLATQVAGSAVGIAAMTALAFALRWYKREEEGRGAPVRPPPPPRANERRVGAAVRRGAAALAAAVARDAGSGRRGRRERGGAVLRGADRAARARDRAAPGGATRRPAPAGRRRDARLGSLSGGGLVDAARTYPAQLRDRLADRYPDSAVDVRTSIRRGATAADMAAAIRTEVMPLRPTLVVWHVGAVDAMRHVPPGEFNVALEEGIAALQRADVDVVLVERSSARTGRRSRRASRTAR
jgi:hypothetical protein